MIVSMPLLYERYKIHMIYYISYRYHILREAIVSWWDTLPHIRSEEHAFFFFFFFFFLFQIALSFFLCSFFVFFILFHYVTFSYFVFRWDTWLMYTIIFIDRHIRRHIPHALFIIDDTDIYQNCATFFDDNGYSLFHDDENIVQKRADIPRHWYEFAPLAIYDISAATRHADDMMLIDIIAGDCRLTIVSFSFVLLIFFLDFIVRSMITFTYSIRLRRIFLPAWWHSRPPWWHITIAFFSLFIFSCSFIDDDDITACWYIFSILRYSLLRYYIYYIIFNSLLFFFFFFFSLIFIVTQMPCRSSFSSFSFQLWLHDTYYCW